MTASDLGFFLGLDSSSGELHACERRMSLVVATSREGRWWPNEQLGAQIGSALPAATLLLCAPGYAERPDRPAAPGKRGRLSELAEPAPA